MTCFDLCPHQMVSLQLLNPPSPPGSCLQTTFGFTHPLIFKNKNPSGVFAFLHCPFLPTSSSLQPPSDPLPPDLLSQWLCLEVMMVKKIYTQECTIPHHPCASNRAATSYFCTSPFPLHTMQGNCGHHSIKMLVPCLNSSLLFILVCGSR